LLNFPDGLCHRFAAGHKQIGRINRDQLEVHHLLSSIGINRMDAFDFISKKRDPHRIIGIGQVNVYIIALHAKRTSGKIGSCAAVQAFHQSMQETLAAHGLPSLDGYNAFVKLYGVTDTINA